jgi:HAD superfamily hydrolase (TIGR01509 family)
LAGAGDREGRIPSQIAGLPADGHEMLFIFDCDGVLVDSEILAARVDSELLTKAGYPITPEEVIQRFAGLTAEAFMRVVEEEMGHPLPSDFHDDQRSELDDLLAREVTAVAGVEDMLERIDGPRCIGSNSTDERLKLMLTRTGLYDRFRPYIYSARQVGDGQPKPSPNVYRHAIKEFGVDPREALIVEDSVFGVRAAKAAGARVVGFTGGAHSWQGHADMLTEAGAATVIKRFADLPAVADALVAWGGMEE